MTSLSAVVISLNEGDSLRRTVDNLSKHASAAKRDHRSGRWLPRRQHGLLEPRVRGCHAAAPGKATRALREHAISAPRRHGDVLVFSDAHVQMPEGWHDPLLETLARPNVGAVAPAIGMLQPGAPEARGSARNGPTPAWPLDGSASRAATLSGAAAVRMLPGHAPRGV